MVDKLKIILLANWGLGLEVLKVLDSLPCVELDGVVSQFVEQSDDPWKNSVYNFARERGYTVFSQKDVNFEKLREIIIENQIDLLVSHSFMRIIPPSVLSAPKRGCINIHAALLPRHRGPSPTYWVLKNREKETGLTCHFMDEGIDTGDIIYQLKIPVLDDDNIGMVIERQKTIVKALLVESFARLLDVNFVPQIQNSAEASYSPRPTSKV